MYADKPGPAVGCQTLFELNDNRHQKLVVPLKGEIREAWGLGSIWRTCCGVIYGMFSTK